MPLPPVLTVSRVKYHRSRQLIADSRRLMASAEESIAQARQSLARQSYVRIVCAWCQATIRFERCTVPARGQISHSICYACVMPVFRELEPVYTPLPVSAPAT
jgi:hypothetical protein